MAVFSCRTHWRLHGYEQFSSKRQTTFFEGKGSSCRKCYLCLMTGIIRCQDSAISIEKAKMQSASAVNELETAGYIRRRQTTDASGKFAANEYTILSVPSRENRCWISRCRKPDNGKPVSGKSVTGKSNTIKY